MSLVQIGVFNSSYRTRLLQDRSL